MVRERQKCAGSRELRRDRLDHPERFTAKGVQRYQLLISDEHRLATLIASKSHRFLRSPASSSCSIVAPTPEQPHRPTVDQRSSVEVGLLGAEEDERAGYDGARDDREGTRMILVTGGLGFIGLHTARALIDQGEDVVLTQFRVAREPDFIKADIGVHAFVEQLDVTDAERLAEIGKKYPITKIAHLAVPGMNALSASEDLRTNMFGLINLLEAAETWGVARIGVASSGTVYGGTTEIPQREDVRVPLVGTNPTEAFKKSFEVLGGHFADRTGLDFLNLRISSIWGFRLLPLDDESAEQGRARRGSRHRVEGGSSRPELRRRRRRHVLRKGLRSRHRAAHDE